jgi:hypothetical protein
MKLKLILLLSLAVTTFAKTGSSQPFVHPGGLHTLADLERMKTNVLAGNHPWIDDWNRLLADRQAQNNYVPASQANMGVSRQRADADAHAAYLNALYFYHLSHFTKLSQLKNENTYFHHPYILLFSSLCACLIR